MIPSRHADKGPGGIPHRHDSTTTRTWWLGLRGMFNRACVLTSGLYCVVTAHFSASQLVLLGASMSRTLLLADIPAGVWADSISRKWAVVLGQLVLAAAMVLTSLVTAFPLLVARLGRKLQC